MTKDIQHMTELTAHTRRAVIYCQSSLRDILMGRTCRALLLP